MKRKVFSVMALAAVLMSASCSKEDPAKPVDFSNVPAEKQATIQGKVLVNKNTTATTPVYAALQGVTVRASVTYSSLGVSGSTESYSTSTTTDSKGEFTLKVPATASGVPVTFNIDVIEGTQTQNVVNPTTGTPAPLDVKGYWTVSSFSETVKAGQTIFVTNASTQFGVIIGTFTQSKSAGDPV